MKLALALAFNLIPALAAGHFKLDFEVLHGNSKLDLGKDRRPTFVKRADSEEMELHNEQSFYRADLKIGSQEDKVGVLVDTGSSDLWVMPPDVVCGVTPGMKKRGLKSGVEFNRLGNEPMLEKRKNFADLNALEDAIRAHEDADALDEQNQHKEVAGPTKSDNSAASQVNKDGDSNGFLFFSTIWVTSAPTGLSGGGSGGGFSAAGPDASRTTNTCTEYGSYETGNSDTWSKNDTAPEFYIQYADGTSATGVWGQDNVEFGGTNVTDLSFALVNHSDSAFGVLGIGLPGLESTYTGLQVSGTPYQYENLPMRLKLQGLISKNVYSLYLNSPNANTGTLLFGAIDRAKYLGQLETVPIVNIYEGTYKHPIRLDISMTGLSFNSSSQNETVSTSSYPALLDSGTTLTYLPSSLFNRVTSLFSASYSRTYGYYQVDCDFNTNSASLVFQFSGIQIAVPLSEFIITGGRNQCFLGIMEQSSLGSSTSYAVMGGNFLRSAYVVYDLDDYTISMAQANYSSDEDIQVVESLIPNALSASGSSSTPSFGSSSSDDDSGSSVTAVDSGNVRSSDASSARWSWPLAAVMAGAAFALA